jgi:hypothetical protein
MRILEYLFMISLISDHDAILRVPFLQDLKELPSAFKAAVEHAQQPPTVVVVDVDGSAFFSYKTGNSKRFPEVIEGYTCGGVLFCNSQHMIADVYSKEEKGL